MKEYSPLTKAAVEYTRHLLATQTKPFARQRVAIIQEFIDFFPEIKSPDDVYLSERAEYHEHLLVKYSAPFATTKMKVLCAFWNWMRRKEYASYNPFKALNPMY